MLNGSLEAFYEEAKRLHAQAEAEAESARLVYETAKSEAKRLHDILRVAGLIEPPPSKPKKEARPPENVSDETREGVLAAIRSYQQRGLAVIEGVPGSFLIEDLPAPVHTSSVRKAIYILREEGIVRAVGTVQNGAPRPPTAYALVDDFAYEVTDEQ